MSQLYVTGKLKVYLIYWYSHVVFIRFQFTSSQFTLKLKLFLKYAKLSPVLIGQILSLLGVMLSWYCVDLVLIFKHPQILHFLTKFSRMDQVKFVEDSL